MASPIYRFVPFRCEAVDRDLVLKIVARYSFARAIVGDVVGIVRIELDLCHPALQRGDGACAELMVRRELDLAIALHRDPNKTPPWCDDGST